MIDAINLSEEETGTNHKREVGRMKVIGISALFIVLWLVVCMPQLNNAMEESPGTSSIVALLHW